MLSSNEQSNALRYERKFLINDFSYTNVIQMVKMHPSCFSEIFYPRTVNNIYFDTLGMNNYYDNIEGEMKRLKVRIRWYGELFGLIQKPVLEFKIKKGLLGKKESYQLNSFILDNAFNSEQIKNAFNTGSIPQQIKNKVLSLKPTLLNSYKRRYFLSADKKFRITVDYALSYYRIGYAGNTFINNSKDHNSIVLELKYDSEEDTEAKLISNMFSYTLSKNSKYLQGLHRVAL